MANIRNANTQTATNSTGEFDKLAEAIVRMVQKIVNPISEESIKKIQPQRKVKPQKDRPLTARQEAKQELDKIGAFANKEDIDFRAATLQKEREDVILKNKLEIALLTGRKFQVGQIQKQINDRIKLTDKLAASEKKREDLRNTSFTNLTKQALGPLGAVFGSVTSIIGDTIGQFVAIKDIAVKSFNGLKSAFGSVLGFFGKKSIGKKKPEEEQVNILDKLFTLIKGNFVKQDKKSREEEAESGKKGPSGLKAEADDGGSGKKVGLFAGLLGLILKVVILKKIGKLIGGAVVKAFKFVVAGFKRLGPLILKTVLPFLGRLGPIIGKGLLKVFSAIPLAIGAFIFGAFKSFNESESESIIGKISDAVLGGFAQIIDFFSFGFISKDTVVKFTKDIFASLGEAMNTISDSISTSIQAIVISIKNTFIGMVNGVIDFVADLLEKSRFTRGFAQTIRDSKLDLVETEIKDPAENRRLAAQFQRERVEEKKANAQQGSASGETFVNAATTNVTNNKTIQPATKQAVIVTPRSAAVRDLY